jgi:microcystin degradation protein MlrC
MEGEELTTDRDEQKRATMRRDARELVEDLEEFEDEHGDVLTIDEQQSYVRALSGIERLR